MQQYMFNPEAPEENQNEFLLHTLRYFYKVKIKFPVKLIYPILTTNFIFHESVYFFSAL